MAADPTTADKIPNHIAIIMDGNGRWAKERGLARLEGHRAGLTAVHRAIDACLATGVKYLTLYSFSSENWQRSEAEVSGLMGLFYEALTEHLQDLIGRKVSLKAIGDLDRLPANVRQAIGQDVEATEGLADLTLILAVSYGSREEIANAVKRIASQVEKGELLVSDISEEQVSNALWTSGIPDPDLLIRSSGEMRISNFLLWQLAYAEIVVIPEYWPDFDETILSAVVSRITLVESDVSEKHQSSLTKL
jgi:undecaprenyl diphosphate synthase